MTTLKQIRVVIASPGDVKDEREALDNVIERVNRNTAEYLGLTLRAVRWETDSYPGFHIDGPLGLIDKILKIEDCDILIGIFWKKFGTPTKDGKTGTEHEFSKAYEAWKQKGRPHIMMYFSKKPYYPESTEETEEQLAVLNFKKNLPKEGLCWPYNGPQEFEILVQDHLTGYIYENSGLDDVIETIDGVTRYCRRDKSTICNALVSTNETIERWYKAIHKHFDDADLTDKDNYAKLKRFVWKREIQPVAERCAVVLEEVVKSFENNELGSLQNELDIKKMKEIIKNIHSFIDETRASDRRIYQKVYENPGPTQEEIDDFILNLLANVDMYRQNVNIATSQVMNRLHCDHMSQQSITNR